MVELPFFAAIPRSSRDRDRESETEGKNKGERKTCIQMHHFKKERIEIERDCFERDRSELERLRETSFGERGL